MIDGGFQERVQHVDHPQRFAAYVTQLAPQLIEPGFLIVVEHQPRQMIVLAVQQRQREQFIDGDQASTLGYHLPQGEVRSLPIPEAARIGDHADHLVSRK